MEKLIAFILSLIICFGSFLLVNTYYDNKIEEIAAQNPTFEGSNKSLSNYNILKKLLTEQDNNTNILVMGSSELSRYNVKSFPSDVFNNGLSPITVRLFGQGYYQSMIHTIALGAMDQEIKNNKVVFIVSPQWFTQKGAVESFANVYSESLMEQFINNDRITSETKNKVIARTKDLLQTNKDMLETLERYERVQYEKLQQTEVSENEKKLPFALTVEDKLAIITKSIKNSFFELKEKKEFVNSFEINPVNTKKAAAESFDFNKLMAEAEQQGKENCTNNPFYVGDEYFNKYMKSVYTTYKNTSEGYIKNSPEFGDLQLFIDLAKELDKEVLIVSVPMNAYWYDYIGYDKSQRAAYYEKIRQISGQNAIKLADYSDKEYEKYFLRDIMHVGWKGWAYIDEAIYNFAKE